jgi:hypothetical protein
LLDDASALSDGNRPREISAILATGIARLRARSALPTDPPESSLTCLDSPAETSLSVRVVNGTDTDERNET